MPRVTGKNDEFKTGKGSVEEEENLENDNTPLIYRMVFLPGEDGYEVTENRKEILEFAVESALRMCGLKNTHKTSDSDTEESILIEILANFQLASKAEIEYNKIHFQIPAHLLSGCVEQKTRDGVDMNFRLSNFLCRCIDTMKSHHRMSESEHLADEPEFQDRRRHVFVGCFHRTEEGHNASQKSMKKLEHLYRFGLEKLKELRNDTHEDDPIDLVYQRHNPESIAGNENAHSFFINLIPLTAGSVVKASATGNTIRLEVPTTFIAGLPSPNARVWSESQLNYYDTILCYLLHEMCHVFGALHSTEGLMSGPIKLLERDIRKFKLNDCLDEHSIRIVSEKLGTESFTDSMTVVRLNRDDNRIKFMSQVEMQTISFVKQTVYKRTFYMFNHEYSCVAPSEEDWDAILVSLAYGQTFYFTKIDIYNTENWTIALRGQNSF